MDKQFAASEVRRLSNRIPRSNDEIADAQEALRAFADMLEAQERAEAIGFLSAGALAALVDCRSDDYNGTVDLWMRSNDAVKATIPVYTRPSPSDAERLAEALRNLVAASRYTDAPDEHEAAEAALAAHSAQAQPPAASVPDAMVRRLKRALPLFCADVTMADARAALEAALAAQESRNG